MTTEEPMLEARAIWSRHCRLSNDDEATAQHIEAGGADGTPEMAAILEALSRTPPVDQDEVELADKIAGMEPPSDHHTNAWMLGFCRARKMAADMVRASIGSGAAAASPAPEPTTPSL